MPKSWSRLSRKLVYFFGLESKAISALNHTRFDITAKTIFGRSFLEKNCSSYPKRVYEEHLRVWNGFFEKNPPKTTKEDFLKAYEQILASHRLKEFRNSSSRIPISPNGQISNGSHRIASAIVQDKKVIFERSAFTQPTKFDANFFREKGLSENILDSMTLEYLRLRQTNLHMVLLYPIANQHDQAVDSILDMAGVIINEKVVTIHQSGTINFIHQVYFGENWFSRENQTNLVNKTIESFGTNQAGQYKVKAILLEVNNSRGDLAQAKNEIRKQFSSHHFVHTTDTRRECLVVAKMIFNSNSICFINKQDLTKSTPRFDELFSEYDSLPAHDERCIDSGGVLAAYGLRDTGGDLDYLYRTDGMHPRESPGGISNHLSQSQFFAETIDEIITNPQKHFYYVGQKFATLDVVKNMKIRRNEAKDQQDIMLIEAIDYLK